MTEFIKIVRVVFYCTTCEHYNTMNRGMPNHIERQVEYDSLTSAYEHMILHGLDHNLEGRIENEND